MSQKLAHMQQYYMSSRRRFLRARQQVEQSRFFRNMILQKLLFEQFLYETISFFVNLQKLGFDDENRMIICQNFRWLESGPFLS